MERTTTFAVRDAAGKVHGFAMTVDATPYPGEVLRVCGYGVTIVKRDPPSRPGTRWIAPYGVNCAEHGSLVSRTTIDQASDEAHAHMASQHPTAADRVFTPARQAQGFRSQAHLDAHFAHSDHVRACGECRQPGPAAWLEGDASWQPTMRECAEGQRLFRESW